MDWELCADLLDREKYIFMDAVDKKAVANG